MTLGQVTLLVHAALMLVGGYVGFKKAGSRPSLVAGVASAVLLLGAWLVALSEPTIGAWIGAGIAALLAVVFAVRLSKTRKFMPSGLLLAVSLAAMGLLVFSATRTG